MESYLGGAASLQNRRAKPWARRPREPSQGAPAMGRREEAGSRDLAGGRLPPNAGRVSPHRTKPSLRVPPSSGPTTKAVRWLGGKVLPALRPGNGFVSPTAEVPRGSSFGSISRVDKARPKGPGYAPAAGTATPWPRSQGCLQRQSRPSLRDDQKAKPQSDSGAFASSWGKLASAKKRPRTPGPPRRTVPPRGEPSCPVGVVSPFLGYSSVRQRNRSLPRAIGVAWCGKSARQSNRRKGPHCDNGEGVASASPLPTGAVVVTRCALRRLSPRARLAWREGKA